MEEFVLSTAFATSMFIIRLCPKANWKRGAHVVAGALPTWDHCQVFKGFRPLDRNFVSWCPAQTEEDLEPPGMMDCVDTYTVIEHWYLLHSDHHEGQLEKNPGTPTPTPSNEFMKKL